jgi:hypothetical protein
MNKRKILDTNRISMRISKKNLGAILLFLCWHWPLAFAAAQETTDDPFVVAQKFLGNRSLVTLRKRIEGGHGIHDGGKAGA